LSTHGSATIERHIELLVADPRYLQLAQIRPHFDLFDFLGNLNENASSRAIAFLLDSGAEHGLGTRFYNAFLHHVYREGQASRQQLSLSQLLAMHAEATKTTTEWSTRERRRVDILVSGYAPNSTLKTVIGIENKHWAEEQEKQVADYQHELCSRFPDPVAKMILFLAPSLRAARTVGNFSECPCDACSYAAVIAALHEVKREASGEIHLLISSLITHFDKTLQGNRLMNDPAKKLVHELYRHPEHRAAIKHLIANVPTLAAIADPMLDRLRKRLQEMGGPFSDESFEEDFYPKNRNNLREIKLRPLSLKDHTTNGDFTFTYLLYAKEGQTSDVPDLGDWVRVQLCARCHTEAGRSRVQQLKLADQFPVAAQAEPTSAGGWEALWSPQFYQLQDFGERDIESCAELFCQAIALTLPTLTEAVQREFGSPAADV